MKIRAGFVSNSSASSFCIYGAPLSEDDFTDPKVYERLVNEIDDSKIEVHWCYDEKFFGKSYYNMRKDQTRREFEKEVQETLDRLTGKHVECSLCEEAWMNN